MRGSSARDTQNVPVNVETVSHEIVMVTKIVTSTTKETVSYRATILHSHRYLMYYSSLSSLVHCKIQITWAYLFHYHVCTHSMHSYSCSLTIASELIKSPSTLYHNTNSKWETLYLFCVFPLLFIVPRLIHLLLMARDKSTHHKINCKSAFLHAHGWSLITQIWRNQLKILRKLFFHHLT